MQQKKTNAKSAASDEQTGTNKISEARNDFVVPRTDSWLPDKHFIRTIMTRAMSYTARLSVRRAISLLFFYRRGEMRFAYTHAGPGLSVCVFKQAAGSISDLLGIHYYFNCGPAFFFPRPEPRRRSAALLRVCDAPCFLFCALAPTRSQRARKRDIFYHRATAIRSARKLSHFLTTLNFDAAPTRSLPLPRVSSVPTVPHALFAPD